MHHPDLLNCIAGCELLESATVTVQVEFASLEAASLELVGFKVGQMGVPLPFNKISHKLSNVLNCIAGSCVDKEYTVWHAAVQANTATPAAAAAC